MDKHCILSGGALAGLRDAIQGEGSSTATTIILTDHEIYDMINSGQAYSLDGKYRFLNDSLLLRRLAKPRHDDAGNELYFEG